MSKHAQNRNPHRFDKIARRAVSPIWDYVRGAITSVRQRLRDRTDDMRDIKRALAKAEAFARDALLLMAEKLFVFPAKLRERREVVEVQRNPTTPRAPLFKLGLETCEPSVGWIEQSEIHHADSQHEPSPVDCAALNPLYDSAWTAMPVYSDAERIERRFLALEDVMTAPGRHAARMKRALHKQDAESEEPFTLKSEDDLLIDHANRLCDDPACFNAEDCKDASALIHKMIFDSS